MGKCNLSFFVHGMVVGEREADLSVTKTADLLEFSPTTVPNVDKDWHEKKHPVCYSSTGRNTLLTRGK